MTDKKQQEQDCYEWIKKCHERMKAYWLEILLGIIAIVTIPVATWILWDCLMGKIGSGYPIQTLVFTFIILGLLCGFILAIIGHRLGGVLIILASLLTEIAICNWEFLTTGEAENGLTIRTLVLVYGAIGAFYGLILATRRLKATEEQLIITQGQLGYTQQQLHQTKRQYHQTKRQFQQTEQQLKISEEGLFNDRLGRGVELLNSNNLYSRTAGIRILGDLHKTVEPSNQKLIRESLLDFIRDKAGIYPNKRIEHKQREERKDIENAIRLLGELVSAENMSLEKKRKELDMRQLNLYYLHLPHTKLQGAIFEGVNFNSGQLQRANFKEAKLQRANFDGASLEMTDLTRANLAATEKLLPAQLDKAIYEKGNPPQNVPAELLPIQTNRAYEWVEDENGNRRRRFVESGEWIDPPPS